MIRPVIEALIRRGRVQLDEIYPLNCTQEESDALVPALTETALAMRLTRTIANTPAWQPAMPGFHLRALAQEASRRLDDIPAGLPQYTARQLSVMLSEATVLVIKDVQQQTGNPPTGYVALLCSLSMNAAARLFGGL